MTHEEESKENTNIDGEVKIFSDQEESPEEKKKEKEMTSLER